MHLLWHTDWWKYVVQSTFQSRQPFPAPLSVGPCALSHRHAQPQATALLPSTPWVVSLVFPRWHLKRMCCAYLSHYVCVCLGVCRCMCVCAEATDVACLFSPFSFLILRQGSYSPGACQIGETSWPATLRESFPLQCWDLKFERVLRVHHHRPSFFKELSGRGFSDLQGKHFTSSLDSQLFDWCYVLRVITSIRNCWS